MFRTLARKIANRRSRSAILMYHRVAAVAHDPWGLAVSPENFAAQLSALKRRHHVLPLREFVQRHRAGTLRNRSIAISFDDGYVDNLTAAAPILSDAGLPATLFLATGPTNRGESYWFEDLSALILDATKAAEVTIDANGPLHLSFGEREEADEQRDGWRAWDEPRTTRERVFHATWDRIRRLDREPQEAAMAQLSALLGPLPDHGARPMTPDEVRYLAAGPFSLGGHTIDHSDLLELDDAAALGQIAGGKAEAEALAGQPIHGFAYPYGRHDERVARLAREAGFDWACTTEHGHMASWRDPYLLPRISAEDRPDIDWLM